MAGLRWSVGVVTLVFAAVTPVVAQQPSPAGRIKTVSGPAFIVRDGATIPAQPGQVVFEADALRTGADGSVGVTLKDDTRLSLGPNSEVRLERFVYAPGERQLRFGCSSSSAAWRRTSPAGWRSSRPTPSVSKRRRRSSAFAGRPWRSASSRR